jgi:hypothetical protein
MKPATLAVIIGLLLAAAPAQAQSHHISKQHARSAGYRFLAPVVDLLDVNRTVDTHMARPGLCHRVSARTVDCHFWAYLVASHTLASGKLRVHLQRDGLLGFLLPWDPARYAVPLGEPASTNGVAQPVQVGVQ